MTNWKALCAELADNLHRYQCWYIEDNGYGLDDLEALLRRADAALAQPEPEGPTPQPADGEVAELVAELKNYVQQGTPLRVVPSVVRRAASLLERLSPPQPVPMSERLPGPGDCVHKGDDDWCWGQERSLWTGEAAFRWRLMRVSALVDEAVAWLPAHALPLPGEGEA